MTTTVQPKPTAKMVRVTPKMAQQWLVKNHKNRNLRNAKVDRYARDLVAGAWRFTGETIKFDWDGNLIDGQHRLAAILKADVEIDLLVVRDVDPKAQDVMDTGAARTTVDMLQLNGKQNSAVLAAGTKLCLNWQAGNIKTSHSTLILNPTHSEILAFVELDDRIVWSATLAQALYPSLRNARPSVLCFSIWLTSAVDAKASREFHQSLADMATGGPGDPRYALLRRLNAMQEEKTSQVGQAFVFVKAWNAWRAGDSLSKLQTGGGGVKTSQFPEPK